MTMFTTDHAPATSPVDALPLDRTALAWWPRWRDATPQARDWLRTGNAGTPGARVCEVLDRLTRNARGIKARGAGSDAWGKWMSGSIRLHAGVVDQLLDGLELHPPAIADLLRGLGLHWQVEKALEAELRRRGGAPKPEASKRRYVPEPPPEPPRAAYTGPPPPSADDWFAHSKPEALPRVELPATPSPFARLNTAPQKRSPEPPAEPAGEPASEERMNTSTAPAGAPSPPPVVRWDSKPKPETLSELQGEVWEYCRRHGVDPRTHVAWKVRQEIIKALNSSAGGVDSALKAIRRKCGWPEPSAPGTHAPLESTRPTWHTSEPGYSVVREEVLRRNLGVEDDFPALLNQQISDATGYSVGVVRHTVTDMRHGRGEGDERHRFKDGQHDGRTLAGGERESPTETGPGVESAAGAPTVEPPQSVEQLAAAVSERNALRARVTELEAKFAAQAEQAHRTLATSRAQVADLTARLTGERDAAREALQQATTDELGLRSDVERLRRERDEARKACQQASLADQGLTVEANDLRGRIEELTGERNDANTSLARIDRSCFCVLAGGNPWDGEPTDWDFLPDSVKALVKALDAAQAEVRTIRAQTVSAPQRIEPAASAIVPVTNGHGEGPSSADLVELLRVTGRGHRVEVLADHAEAALFARLGGVGGAA